MLKILCHFRVIESAVVFVFTISFIVQCIAVLVSALLSVTW